MNREYRQTIKSGICTRGSFPLWGRQILLTLIFLFLISGAVVIAAQEPGEGEIRQILFINSYNQRMSRAREILSGVEDVLALDEANLSLHVENMDTKVFYSQDYFDSFRNHLQVKYRDIDFSLILCSDNNAYDFLRQHRDTLFPGVPVSFCGVNDFDEEQLAGLEGFTGIASVFSATETAELILRLHPDTTELFVINDYLVSGRAWARDIEKELRWLPEQVKLRHSDNLSLQDQRGEIARLGPGSVALLGVYFADGEGLSYTFERMGVMLSEVSNVPFYCLHEFNIGKGVVGGNVISAYFQGRTMAEIGLEILKGRNPESIPVKSKEGNRFIFNYPQLQRFGIEEDQLPLGSSIVNRPYSFYEAYMLEIWSLISVFLLLLVAVFGVSFGLWRSRRAEERIRSLRNYLSNIIDSMPSLIIGVDLDLRITQWNSEAVNRTGVSIEEALGKNLFLILPRMSGERKNIDKAIRSRRILSFSRQYESDEGRVGVEEATIYPLVADGVEGAVIRVDDVTEKNRMEETMIQSEKMLSVGGLAAGMAHEINNPLAGMIQTAHVMADRLGGKMGIAANVKAAEEAGTTIEAVRAFMEARGIPEMLSAVNESGRRVAAIVENMLSFARKSDDRKSSHSLEELIDKSLEMASTDYDLKKQYDFKAIRIEKEYEENLPLIPCEGTKIQQVLLNILRNGSEAMQEAKTEAPRFIIRTYFEEYRNLVCLEIEDNGPGMDDEIRKRVFEPFFTTKPEGVGTGLGLSVSYFIVTKNHGGEMAVESHPGTGTKFIVRLPLQ